jgi:hypothetical protein
VRIDDELKTSPQLNRWRPTTGITPKITDTELITLAVLQALLGYHQEPGPGKDSADDPTGPPPPPAPHQP